MMYYVLIYIYIICAYIYVDITCIYVCYIAVGRWPAMQGMLWSCWLL